MPIPEGVILKLERARHHLDVFDRNDYMALLQEPDSISRRVERGGMEHIYIADRTPAIPADASVIIGDVLHNARSALDNLVFPLVDQPAMSERVRRGIAFPICADPDEFAERQRRCLPGASLDLVRVVEECQPYPGRHRVQGLEWVRDLNNVDKHRSIHTVASIADETRWAGLDYAEKPWVTHDVVEAETVVARFTFKTPSPNADPEFDMLLCVAFGESGPYSGLPVWDVLNTAVTTIEYEVVPRFQQLYETG